MKRILLLAMALAPLALLATRPASQVVLGDDAKDCDCPDPTPTPTPTASPTFEPTFSPTPTPDAALEAIRSLGFAAVWEKPGTLLVTLSDETARFDNASSELKPDALERLNKLSALLGQYPGNTVSVTGHTDKRGSQAYNLRLSRKRAERVRDVMVSMQVPADSFTEVEGFGPDKPINTSGTPEGDAENRRVEIRIRIKQLEIP